MNKTSPSRTKPKKRRTTRSASTYTTEWPALWPPAARAQTRDFWQRMSLSFPLPSSPAMGAAQTPKSARQQTKQHEHKHQQLLPASSFDLSKLTPLCTQNDGRHGRGSRNGQSTNPIRKSLNQQRRTKVGLRKVKKSLFFPFPSAGLVGLFLLSTF
jgi:hypothetical protein